MDCNCTRQGTTDTHDVECPASLYQAGIQRGRREAEDQVVRWLRSYNDSPRRGQLADRIERGEHKSF